MLEGVVKMVIADSQTNSSDENDDEQDNTTKSGAPSTAAFKATIALRDQQLKAADAKLSLAAGMQLSAEIIQDKRTVLEYLLSPVKHVTSEAVMER